MRLSTQHTLPNSIYIGCSGGADSMAVAHSLMKYKNVSLIFVNHGKNTNDNFAYDYVYQFAKKHDLTLDYHEINDDLPNGKSQEEHWRNERYKIFHMYDHPVITAHHLDDCVETWVFSSLHGQGKIIPYKNKNVIRPYRLLTKNTFREYNRIHNVDYYEDEDNTDISFMRNHIRHKMMPDILTVNPGIRKMIRKKVLET